MTSQLFVSIRRLAVASVVTGALACGGSSAVPVQTTPPTADGRLTPSDLEAIARAQADSARHPYTVADVHFMTTMVSHHAQAIKMANWAPTHGASPSIRTLAARIINAQQDEINLMRQWLKDRRQPIPEANPDGMRMTMNGMDHQMLMPGMLTPEQMTRLDQARGTEFDRLFLTFMIQHHRGATEMVKVLFATDGAGQNEQVFKFASDVNVDQATEIARMERMLESLQPASRAP